MSVEKKIKQMLESAGLKKDSDQTQLQEAATMGNESIKKDTSVKTAVTGDTSQPKQGDSKDASYETRNEDELNQGAKVSGSIKKQDLKQSGPGATPNFTTVADATSVVNQSSSKGNVVKESFTELFAGDETISEEFKSKAEALFEAAVVARVSTELETARTALAEEVEATKIALEEAEEIRVTELAEALDKYTDFLTAKWLEENSLAIEQGQKQEILESFVHGMRAVFAESYIGVPDNSLEQINKLSESVEEAQAKLNESLEAQAEMFAEMKSLRRSVVLAESVKGMTDIDAEKLTSLVESIESDDEEEFKLKIETVKESMFSKKATKPDAEKTLVESVEANQGQAPAARPGSLVDQAAQALSRTAKYHRV